MKNLLLLYPRAWRKRYGAEVEALMEDTGTSIKCTVDVVLNALRERWIYGVRSARQTPRRARSTAKPFNRALVAGFRAASDAIASPTGRQGLRAFRQRPTVYSAMALYGVASIALMATHSTPISIVHIILPGLVFFAIVGKARPLVWDWLPFVFVALMFEDLTAVGAEMARAVHTTGPVVFERTLVGGAAVVRFAQSRPLEALAIAVGVAVVATVVHRVRNNYGAGPRAERSTPASNGKAPLLTDNGI